MALNLSMDNIYNNKGEGRTSRIIASLLCIKNDTTVDVGVVHGGILNTEKTHKKKKPLRTPQLENSQHAAALWKLTPHTEGTDLHHWYKMFATAAKNEHQHRNTAVVAVTMSPAYTHYA